MFLARILLLLLSIFACFGLAVGKGVSRDTNAEHSSALHFLYLHGEHVGLKTSSAVAGDEHRKSLAERTDIWVDEVWDDSWEFGIVDVAKIGSDLEKSMDLLESFAPTPPEVKAQGPAAEQMYKLMLLSGVDPAEALARMDDPQTQEILERRQTYLDLQAAGATQQELLGAQAALAMGLEAVVDENGEVWVAFEAECEGSGPCAPELVGPAAEFIKANFNKLMASLLDEDGELLNVLSDEGSADELDDLDKAELSRLGFLGDQMGLLTACVEYAVAEGWLERDRSEAAADPEFAAFVSIYEEVLPQVTNFTAKQVRILGTDVGSDKYAGFLAIQKVGEKAAELSQLIGAPFNPAGMLAEAAIGAAQEEAIEKCSGFGLGVSGFDCAQAAFAKYQEEFGDAFSCQYYEDESQCGQRYLSELNQFLDKFEASDYLPLGVPFMGPPPPSMKGAGDMCAYLGVGALGCEVVTGEVPTPGVIPIPRISIVYEISTGGGNDGADDENDSDSTSEGSDTKKGLPDNGVDYDTVSTAKEGQSTTPTNGEERSLWDNVVENPTAGDSLKGLNNDPRFRLKDGFQKMQQTTVSDDGQRTVIHYQYNKNTGKAYDIKITHPRR